MDKGTKRGGFRVEWLGGGGGGLLGSSDLVAIPAGDNSLRGNIGNQKQFSTTAAGLSFLAAWAVGRIALPGCLQGHT